MYAFGVFEFHPLQGLTGEQFFQFAEAMPRQKRKQLGVLRSENTFEKRINQLIKKAICSNGEADRRHNIYHLRNTISHHQKRIIFSHMDAIGFPTY
jgi:putative aminopeptidase FrvX